MTDAPLNRGPDEDEVSCRHCLSPIPRGATVCRACQTHQNPILANIGFLSSGAAMVVALLSLGTSLYGLLMVRTQLHIPKSDIRLTAPQVHDGTVTLNAINIGDAPGSLRAVTIDSKMLGGSLPLTSNSADDEFVPVGAKRVTFRYRTQLSLDGERRAREDAALMPSGDGQAGTINIMIVESDGTERFDDVPIPIGRFLALENERMEKQDDDAGMSGNSAGS